MTNEEIKNILRLHKMWLDGYHEGESVDLRDADLRGADLRGANLSGADLISANLDFSVFPLDVYKRQILFYADSQTVSHIGILY